MNKYILIVFALIMRSEGSLLTQSDLELRARIIRDVVEGCTDQLEERILALELLCVDSTAPEKPILEQAGYDRIISAAKRTMERLKAYSPSTSDLSEFESVTDNQIHQAAMTLRLMFAELPDGIETLLKERDLIISQRVEWLNLGRSIAELKLDREEMRKLRGPDENLKSYVEHFIHMLETFPVIVEELRGPGDVNGEKYPLQFDSLDELTAQASRALNRVRKVCTWSGMSQESRVEYLTNLHGLVKKGSLIVGKLIADPEFGGLTKETMVQVQEAHLRIAGFLDFLEDRLDQMKPKRRDYIEDLIKYVASYHKDAINV